jgi:DNA-binding NtrC family response regulator
MNSENLQLRSQSAVLNRGKSLKRILVVGREDDHRMLLATLLGEEGHSVWACGSANEALNLLQIENVDFVIIDHCAPELDGMHLLEKTKQLDASIPVLIISEQYEVEPYITAMNLGALDYFGKPIDYTDVQRVVNTFENPSQYPRNNYVQ